MGYMGYGEIRLLSASAALLALGVGAALQSFVTAVALCAFFWAGSYLGYTLAQLDQKKP